MLDVDTAPPRLVFVPPEVTYYKVQHRYCTAGMEAEIRHYRWNSTIKKLLSPAHHFLDLSLTKRARGSLLADPSRNHLRHPGRVVFLPAGSSCLGMVDMVEHRSLSIAFDDAFVRDTLGPHGSSLFAVCLDLRNPLIQILLMSVLDELMDPGFASDVHLHSATAAILVQLARAGQKSAAGAATPVQRDSRRITRAREFIQANLDRKLDIAALAQLLGTSTRHLTRSFKAATGLTVGEYVAQNRLARAKALLRNAELSIQDVSAQCGFASSQYFASAFRKATGESPTTYRASLL